MHGCNAMLQPTGASSLEACLLQLPGSQLQSWCGSAAAAALQPWSRLPATISCRCSCWNAMLDVLVFGVVPCTCLLQRCSEAAAPAQSCLSPTQGCCRMQLLGWVGALHLCASAAADSFWFGGPVLTAPHPMTASCFVASWRQRVAAAALPAVLSQLPLPCHVLRFNLL